MASNNSGQKHSPNTSEISKPHVSPGHPETHVDTIHFDENGVHSKEIAKNDVDGITDPETIKMGEETKAWHDSKKSDD